MTKQSSLILADDCILEDVDIDGHCEIKDLNGEAVSLKVADQAYKKVFDLKED